MDSTCKCRTTLAQAINDAFPPLTAQQRFDRAYVSTNEVMQRCGVSRAAVCLALKRGMLPPQSIVTSVQQFWERDEIEPYITAWSKVLAARRSTPLVKDAVRRASEFAPIYKKPLSVKEHAEFRPTPILDPEEDE